MSRGEFIEYLASRAEGLKIPLHRAGRLLGLPREFHQALAMTRLLDALGQRAPSSEVLRTWYGKEALASGNAAKWIYRVVGALRDPDLQKLSKSELISFGLRLATWGAAASALAGGATRLRRARRTVPLQPGNPSKDGEPQRAADSQRAHGLRHRHTP
jgi:hypothetical protein